MPFLSHGKMFFSGISSRKKDGSFYANKIRKAVLTIRFTTQSIHLREKQKQVRPRDQQCICIAKLAEKDLRFSMKMMFATDSGTKLQPFRTVISGEKNRPRLIMKL